MSDERATDEQKWADERARVYASLSERDEKMLHPDYDKEPINEYSGVQWGDLRILLNYCEQLEIERNMLHERLSALLATLRAPVPSGVTESANDRFERLAKAFYDATRKMAPGKDVPMAMGADDADERMALWKAFNAGYRAALAAAEQGGG